MILNVLFVGVKEIRNMKVEELIKLGFKKQIQEDVENPYYYYTLDITDGLSFITQANDEIENGEWFVDIFESPGITFKDVKPLTELINLLNKNKDDE